MLEKLKVWFWFVWLFLLRVATFSPFIVGSYCILNIQYDPHKKTRKNNHSVIVVVVIEMEVKKKNKTVLFFFNTYNILWLNPYYKIHGEISIKLSSLKYVSFFSIVCLFSWLVCVKWWTMTFFYDHILRIM